MEVDETELARVAGGIGDTRALPASGHQPTNDDHVFGHLEPEAESERCRLLFARQFSTDGAPGGDAECLATPARRVSTRVRLNGRTLAIVVSELTDRSGRRVAVQVLPVSQPSEWQRDYRRFNATQEQLYAQRRHAPATSGK